MAESLAKKRKLTNTKASQVTSTVDDVRIAFLTPLLPPACLAEEIPLSEEVAAHVTQSRQQVHACVNGEDDRLVVVVGPCSIHDPEACLEYARKLAYGPAQRLREELLVVMRVYFEKPRTTVGWKVLIKQHTILALSSSFFYADSRLTPYSFTPPHTHTHFSTCCCRQPCTTHRWAAG